MDGAEACYFFFMRPILNRKGVLLSLCVLLFSLSVCVFFVVPFPVLLFFCFLVFFETKESKKGVREGETTTSLHMWMEGGSAPTQKTTIFQSRPFRVGGRGV